MSIITLLTDFGGRDSFVAQMKGVILGINPHATIVDLTHELPPQGIQEAAFHLNSAYRHFPKGTIHVAVVDPGVGGPRRALLAVNRFGRFLAPDNGVLSPIFHDHPSSKIFQLTSPKYRLKLHSATFDGRDVFAPAAGWLSKGVPPSKMGRKIVDPVSFPRADPKRNKDGSLVGRVMQVDRFGNLITNINRSDLAPWISAGKTPILTIKEQRIRGLKQSYAGAAPGEPAALINSDDYLEIFCNQAKARTLFDPGPDEPVLVQ